MIDRDVLYNDHKVLKTDDVPDSNISLENQWLNFIGFIKLN